MPVFVKDDQYVPICMSPKTGGASVERFFLKNNHAMHELDGGGPASLLPALRCSPQPMHAALICDLCDLRLFP